MSGFISLLVLAVLAVPVALIIALARLGQLGRRLSALERSVADLRAHPSTPAPAIQPQATPPASAVPATASPRPTPDRPVAPPASLSPHPPSQWPPPSSAPLPPKQRVATGAPRLAPSDAIARGVRWLRRWFSEGNVPVKVGMLVLFAGVAALLKYAGDQGWMTLPIELRLAGVALAALAGVAFGWKQRHSRRSFALALQGGAIGVLLLVVFAAFKLYPLLPPTAAFALSVVLVAGVGVLAVAQNAIALAWLGILAGFLAPLWLSTGQGSHVALFGYYAVLNAGIFAIAWHRSWRALNVLGFVFTFAIGTLWGVLRYRPEDFATTQPFLALFFAFYLLVPVLNARVRHPASCKQFVVTLKHTGKLPRNVMGHNLVVGRTADIAGINADGMKAGLESEYVKAGDARVIAASKVIGGGETTTVTIPVGKLKAGESYTYFCSFPGHSALMKGMLSIGK